MKAIRNSAKSAKSSKLSKFMRGAKNDTPSQSPAKCYASGGAVGAANNPGPVEGMMAKSRLDRPGRKMDKKPAGTNVTVVVMPKGNDQPSMPMIPPPNAPPPGPPPGPPMPPQGGPPMMPKGPMKTGGRVFKRGGRVSA